MRSMSVASRPRPMMFGMMSSVEPSDGFTWVQGAGGPALVCRPLEALAHHLYMSRHWALGARSAAEVDGAWDQVARAIGVDRDHLVRVHQVHGASVYRPSPERSLMDRGPVPLPAADVIVSDDPSLALAIQTADCLPILVADARTGAA